MSCPMLHGRDEDATHSLTGAAADCTLLAGHKGYMPGRRCASMLLAFSYTASSALLTPVD